MTYAFTKINYVVRKKGKDTFVSQLNDIIHNIHHRYFSLSFLTITKNFYICDYNSVEFLLCYSNGKIDQF
jgi:hypothetical protein